MAKNFNLTNLALYKGYINKADRTNVSSKFLVEGSLNVVSTDEGFVGTRKGYTLFGAADSTLEPITGSVTWRTARGDEIMMRSRNDGTNSGTVEFYHSDIGAWTELINSVGTTLCNFTTDYWDTTEAQDALLFVVGDANLYYWSGGVTTFASGTTNTITKEGTTSWGEEGFLTAGTRTVDIGGTTYTYTGGESTTTLTGVTPDASAAGTAGDTVFQEVRTTSNKPAAALNNDLIAVHRNQVYVGDKRRRDVNVSVVGDYTDYTTATVPRVVGEAAVLTLNETPTAFVAQEDTIYLSTYNQWYKVVWTLSDDLTGESLNIDPLKTNPGGGAINQKSVFNVKNNIFYISNEPTINSLGRVENIDTPQAKDLSDSIKLELDGYDTSNASGQFWRNSAFFAFPAEGKVLQFNIKEGYWEAPLTFPVRHMVVFGNSLYGHSSGNNESYKLFDGTDDNGKAMNAIAAFSYVNGNRRDHKKSFVEWFTEAYMSTNTTLTQTLNYDYKGATRIQEFEIRGDDPKITFAPKQGNPLGSNTLGSQPIGSQSVAPDNLNKIRVIKETSKSDFYEIQTVYSTNDINQQWQILAQGPALTLSVDDNNSIKQ